jgi:hypothetical protein
MERGSSVGDDHQDVWGGSFGLRAVTVLLTLVSGGLMVLAGYLWHESGWNSAAWAAGAAGVLILIAHAAARLADPGARPAAARTGPRLAAFAATMLSGAIMVLAGYAGSAWSWFLAPLLALLGGLVIVVALNMGAA